jgi:hypothetical protein
MIAFYINDQEILRVAEIFIAGAAVLTALVATFFLARSVWFIFQEPFHRKENK